MIANWLDEDWVRYLLMGLGAALLSGLAGWQERRRKHRSDPDKVPWLPWRDLAFWSSFAALLLLVVAFSGWLKS